MLSPTIWLIIGAILILIEVAVLPGVGFLFAGLSAITLGGLISLELLQQTTLSWQIAYFFFLTGVWWAVLWKQLKKLTRNKGGEGYENLSGTYGIVEDEQGLIAGKMGHVKWSGAVMRARIRPDSAVEKIEKGETVWVHEQKDGILLVDITKP